MRPAAATLALLAAGIVFGCGGEDSPDGVLSAQVCGDDAAWERPALQDHAAHIRADNRWREFGPSEEEQFEAHFWGVGHSASGAGYVLEFSGMWNMPNEGRDFYWDAFAKCFEKGNIDRNRYQPLWLFEHEFVSARANGAELKIEVRPRESGVQIVAVELPVEMQGRDYGTVFADEDGDVIASLETLWSTAP